MMSDRIPITLIRDLIEALTTRLRKAGLAKFFDELDDDTYASISISDREVINRTFLRLIEDEAFRAGILAALNGEDRTLVGDFLDWFDRWTDLNPYEYNWVRTRLSGSAQAILRTGIPETVNAFLEAYASITLDSESEQYSVKCGIMLGWADKTLGGDHVLATASPIYPFLGSIVMMLSALRLRDSEIEALKLPQDRPIHENIESALNDIQREVDALKVQFSKLKR
jgi:hypothetical protein